MSRVKNISIIVMTVDHTIDRTENELYVAGSLILPTIVNNLQHPNDVIIALPIRFKSQIQAKSTIRVTYMGLDHPHGESTMQNLEIWDEKTSHWILP